jgi:IS5 family transposase
MREKRDDQVEYQVRDRLSFTRFLRLGIEDSVPDGTTLWLFRETLGKAGLIEKLFERFGQHLEAKGYIARGGQMVDAMIVPVPSKGSPVRSDRGRGRPLMQKSSGFRRKTKSSACSRHGRLKSATISRKRA